MIACIGLVARVTQNKKSIRKSEINLEIRNQLGNQKSTWKSEINLEIRNQSLEIRNQVRNHGDLKSRTLFSKVSYPLEPALLLNSSIRVRSRTPHPPL